MKQVLVLFWEVTFWLLFHSTDFGLVLFLLTLRWTLRSIFIPVDLPLDLSSFTTLHFRNSLAKDLFLIGLIQNTDIDKDVIKAII